MLEAVDTRDLKKNNEAIDRLVAICEVQSKIIERLVIQVDGMNEKLEKYQTDLDAYQEEVLEKLANLSLSGDGFNTTY